MLKRQFSSYNPADVACDTTSNPNQQSEESEQISETRFDKSELVQNGSKRKRSQSFSLFLSPLNHHPETMKIFRDFEDIMAEEQRKRKVWKLVLTGGPCGGKTTGQTRLATFFENLGWKVYRVPETANILLSGGVNFAELSDEAAERFQVSFFLRLKVVNYQINSIINTSSSK